MSDGTPEHLRRIEIIGGAGPYEAAAILAAIDAALTEELTAQATPDRSAPGAWTLSGRPQTVVGPPTTFHGLSPVQVWEPEAAYPEE